MNKKRVFIFASVIIIILSLNLISAQSSFGGIDEIIKTTGSTLETVYNSIVTPLAKFLIGGDAASGENGSKNFFTLVLFLVLLFSVLWEVTERIPILNNNGWIQFIVSLVISVITVRFLGEAGNLVWFQTILLPNQALGILLLCMLPLIFWVVFIQDIGANRPVLRKVLYVASGVLFLTLYLVRYSELSNNASGFSNPANIYFYAALLSFILLLLDGTITRVWHRSWAESAQASGHRRLARMLEREIAELEEDWAQGRIVDARQNPDRARYNRERDSLMQRLLHLRTR